MQRVTIQVGGMSCDGCVTSLSRVLGRLPGVQVERVAVGVAEVRYDESAVSESTLRDAVVRAGFEATAIEAR